jgi:hypothetical protein
MAGFLSYAHEDKKMVRELQQQFPALPVSIWIDQEILAGDDWDQTIKDALNRATLFIFCISPAFVNSRYIQSIELPHARDKHNNGKALIVPVVLKPVMWDHISFLAKLQAVPEGADPIQLWRPQSEGYFDAARRIRLMLERRGFGLKR